MADKLNNSRFELVDDLKYQIEKAKEYDASTATGLVKARFESLNALYDEFVSNRKEIAANASLFEKTTLKAIRKASNELTDQYLEAKAILMSLMPQQERENVFESTHIDHNRNKPNIKLPSIQIKPFTGKYEEWEEFSDLFEACFVNGTSNFTDCQKLLYLKSSLEGEPYNLVKTLKSTNNNFRAAWELLEQRYLNQKKIFNAHVDAILEIPKVKSESASNVKRLLDITNASLSAISALKIDIANIDPFLVHILELKLDNETMKHWAEDQKGATEVPKYAKFQKFLKLRINILEGLETSHSGSEAAASEKQSASKNVEKTSKTGKIDKKEGQCSICKGDHRPYICEKFVAMSTASRAQFVTEKKLCQICLYSHPNAQCRSKHKCAECKASHNSLLHQSSTFAGHLKFAKELLLATAIVPVLYNGTIFYAKTLIDPGSTATIITERAVQKWKLKKSKVNVPISSIDSASSTAKWKTNLTFGSCYDKEFKHNTDAYVVSRICNINPMHTIEQTIEWKHVHGLQLADPTHMKAKEVDMLLGVEVYAAIVKNGLRKGVEGMPVAQNTKCGWILFGSIDENKIKSSIESVSCLALTADDKLERQVQRFWETEECFEEKILTLEEQEVERKFLTETSVGDDGKFIVKLPFRMSPNEENFLGNSYKQAFVRMCQLEKRFSKDKEVQAAYIQSMREAIESKHLRECTREEIEDTQRSYYMPHHAVIKKSSSTTKLRIVFDASAKTTNGFSLNDRLMIGPTIQNDIFHILINWRAYKIAFLADIEKMYKQVWIHPSHARFQRVLWRENPSQSMKQYASSTVTFGTASAPFQAIRALKQIALNEQNEKPLAAKALIDECYVDDIVSGEHTIEKAIEKQSQIISALEKYGFNARKWVAHHQQLLDQIPIENREVKKTIEIEKDNCIKALGIEYIVDQDAFKYSTNKFETSITLTKRKLLSEMCKLFDPLGWIAPVIVLAKILNQSTWKHKIGWDELLPDEITQMWNKIVSELPSIDTIRIGRWLQWQPNARITIHAFCDASEAAYATAVYLHVQSEKEATCNLIASKTKVSPLKQLTLPRLELCGAVLLAKTVNKIVKALNKHEVEIVAWSDSQIALAWIGSQPTRWKTYVANRVATIQNILPNAIWRHVASEYNPADIASRGCTPNQFVNDEQWWHGPKFLMLPSNTWPESKSNENCELEAKNIMVNLAVASANDTIENLINRRPNVSQMYRIIAYCLRMKYHNHASHLSVEEVLRAEKRVVQALQMQHYPHEYQCLEQKRNLDKKSPLLSLAPFLHDGVMRVRGRLENAHLSFDQKHQMIVPKKSLFTDIVIEKTHIELKHSGEQATWRKIREKFWIVRGIDKVRSLLRQCVRCHRFRARMQSQLMADLPPSRVQKCSPFTHTGVDYAGPITIKSSDLRKAPTMKAYISIFICLATKAINIELATDASTDEFMDCYRRFIAVRGIPAKMYSDNGLNFVGASHLMPQLFIEHTQEFVKWYEQLRQSGTQWQFIPPNSPHFGGLWEAAVKSVKTLLAKSIGTTILSYKSMMTVLKQVESILNSRPLCALTDNVDDIEALTPSHFLIGRPLTMLPEPSLLDINTNRLDAYQYRQKIVNGFWQQWSADYLMSLQKRSKWQKVQENMQPGQIVLVHEQNSPPAKWKLARVIEVYPDKEGLVRVVRIKQGDSEYTRPIVKLSLLPITDNLLSNNIAQGGECVHTREDK